MNYIKVKKGTKINHGGVLACDQNVPILPRPKENLSEYDIQAQKFLDKHEITIEVEFIYNGPYFDDESENRDVYKITLSRKGKTFSFKFGNSLLNSTGFVYRNKDGGFYCYPPKKPSAYSVLASLEKYEPPLTFSDFCAEFGYNDDSIKASKTHKAVLEQWDKVRRFFSESELEELQEIN